MQEVLHYLRAVPVKKRSTVTESAQSLPCKRMMLTDVSRELRTETLSFGITRLTMAFFLLTGKKQDQLKQKVESKKYPNSKITQRSS